MIVAICDVKGGKVGRFEMSEGTRAGLKEVALINEESIRDKIYTIRGRQVMLDSDLAEIYGYTTRAFNQQVRNNIGKFDDDFRFQLTWKETELVSRSKNLILNEGETRRGRNAKYRPYVFTEQGIYMLMTVLKGRGSRTAEYLLSYERLGCLWHFEKST